MNPPWLKAYLENSTDLELKEAWELHKLKFDPFQPGAKYWAGQASMLEEIITMLIDKCDVDTIRNKIMERLKEG